ncbi:MAG TPA: hypothetical protein VJO12_09175 [Stellaceae bacterium]|nr:hypothetical protein [Stellaceae bacterium]
MRFFYPIEFEIPDEWWTSAGMTGFAPTTRAYIASSSDEYPTVIVPVEDVEPPRRAPGVERDFRGFCQNGMMWAFDHIRRGLEQEPIPVHELPDQVKFRYAVRDGFHRFYASAAVGFRLLPVSVRPYFDVTKGWP